MQGEGDVGESHCAEWGCEGVSDVGWSGRVGDRGSNRGSEEVSEEVGSEQGGGEGGREGVSGYE